MKRVTPAETSSLPLGTCVVVGLAISLCAAIVMGLTAKAVFVTAFAMGAGVALDLGLFLDSLNRPRFELDTRAWIFRRVCEDHTTTFLASAPGVRLCLHRFPIDNGREIWMLADGRREELFLAPITEQDRRPVLRLLRRARAEITFPDDD